MIETIKLPLFIGTLILTVFSFAQAQQKAGVAFSHMNAPNKSLTPRLRRTADWKISAPPTKLPSITNRLIIRSDKVILLPRRSRAFREAAENFY
jgi:hypothetical protein